MKVTWQREGAAIAMYRFGYSMRAIEGIIGIDHSTVHKILKNNGVSMRPRGKAPGHHVARSQIRAQRSHARREGGQSATV